VRSCPPRLTQRDGQVAHNRVLGQWNNGFWGNTVPLPRADLELLISQYSAYQIVWQQERFVGQWQGGPLSHGRVNFIPGKNPIIDHCLCTVTALCKRIGMSFFDTEEAHAVMLA
jgi:hypothetical protein